MKNKIELLFMLLVVSTFSTMQAQDNLTSEVFLKAINKLQDAYSLQYNVETSYHFRGEDKTIQTLFKQKKLSYDPYAGYSFYKEIDGDIKIYYHFLELGVIEEQKNMLSVFDHKEDPTFSRYVDSYSKDLDNLWRVLAIMETNKESFSYEAKETIKGKEYLKYRVQNYLLWIDAKTDLPYKIESVSRNGSAMVRVFENILLNKEFDDTIFAYPKEGGHVVVNRKPNPEPLVNKEASSWKLKDMKGKLVSLADYKGKPLFIEAWSADCNFCVDSFPTIKEIEQTYGASVAVVTVNMDYDLPKAKRAIQEYQLGFKVLEGDAAFYRDYLIQSFPSYYVIDANGTIVLHERGGIRGASKTKLLQALDEVSKR